MACGGSRGGAGSETTRCCLGHPGLVGAGRWAAAFTALIMDGWLWPWRLGSSNSACSWGLLLKDSRESGPQTTWDQPLLLEWHEQPGHRSPVLYKASISKKLHLLISWDNKGCCLEPVLGPLVLARVMLLCSCPNVAH